MRQSGVRFHRLFAALLTGCLLVPVSAAYGGLGMTVPLPLPPKTAVKGLSLVFDCTWADGNGYVPMRLTISCSPPAKVQRTLAVEITTRARSELRPISVTTDVDIPAGTTSLTKVISFPRFSIGYLLSMKVWEDGVRLDDLSFENMSMFTTAVGQNAAPATLFVTSSQIDVGRLDFLVLANTYAQPGVPQQPANTIAMVGPFTSLAAADLFDDWIHYSSLDVVFISASDVEQLAANRPQVWRALRQWTWAGGNLCVYGVGDDWHGLATLDQRLECPAPVADADKPLGDWNRPKPDLYNLDLRSAGATVVLTDQATAAGGPGGKLPKPPKNPPFVWKNTRFGMTLALASADPFPGTTANWRWLFNTIDPARWQWHARHGLPTAADDSYFDSFLIGDVGLPPVKSYRVLITLFVIGIGPVNYWLLRRRGRLHLLLFTVPAAAIAVSAALLAYAVVADGFDTHLRARSYTELDQRNHEAVSWARLSYYAGVSPSGGLVFPSDTAVFPLERDLDWRVARPERSVTWTSEQHLVRGWLASRTPTQYMTVRPYACRRELLVVESDDAAGCAVENRLDTTIRQVMLRSASGALYYGGNIKPRDRAVLSVLDTDAAVERATRQMYFERSRTATGLPGNVATPASQFFFGTPRSRRYSRFNAGYEASSAMSLLEAGLSGAFDEVGSRLNDPRTYVAIVERPPDVVAGIDGLVESQSLHVIFGTW